MSATDERIRQLCEQQQTLEMDMPPPVFKERMDLVRQMMCSLPPLGKGPHLVAYTAEGQQQVSLRANLRIGSDSTCDLVLDCDYVSRQHCRLECVQGDWIVEDEGSTNGTKVNGELIRRAVLKDGDQIQIGTTKLLFLRAWGADDLVP